MQHLADTAKTDNSEEAWDKAAQETGLSKAIARLSGIFWRKELRHWRPLIFFALLLTVAAKGFAVLAPLLIGDGINAIADSEDATGWPSFAWLILGYAGARLMSFTLPQVRDLFFVRVTQDANRVVAVEAYAHAQSLSLQFHLTRRAGALNRIIERGAAATEFLLRFLAFNIGPTLIELALAASVLQARFGWQFAAIAILTVLGYGAFTITVTDLRTRQRRVLNEADTELKARAMDSLTNFEVVKAFATETRETDRYDQSIRGYAKHYVKLMRSLAGLNTGQEVIQNGGLLAITLLAAYGAANGTLQIGDITAVILILLNIYRPLNILGFAWREIKQGIVDMEKLFGLLDVVPDVADKPNAPAIANPKGHIIFDHVTFRHDGRESGLDTISFTIEPGEFVGLVGASGAGKSTILKLLFRFYDPASGTISIGGEDISEVTQASLRSALGLVPQDVVLFNDTLRYNLAYGSNDVTDDHLWDIIDQASLGDFARSLPEGLETKVGERGLKLSGGEKQRVGIARVLLRNPDILVLDEATSALDSATEADVQQALETATQNRTTIAVAHRLSTLSGADKIIVLEDGSVDAVGTHTALLETSARYQHLWALQAREEA